MDTGLVALVVLGTFATVHERMIELIRRVFGGPPEYTDAKALADGYGKRRFWRHVPPVVPGQDEQVMEPVTPSPGLIRRLTMPNAWRRWRKLLDGATIGPWSVLFAIALAVLTRANALALFAKAVALEGRAEEAVFFRTYLDSFPSSGRFWLLPAANNAVPWRELMGCVLMGLSTALGSRFWHDLSSGLVDLRDKAKELPKVARAVVPPPEAPPSSTVTPVLPPKR